MSIKAISKLRPPPKDQGSWKDRILARPDAKEFISKLSPQDCKIISTSWAFNARDEQYEPEGDDWDVWMFCGGRGAGKALDVNTPIATKDGWKLNGHLVDGDIIFDEKGEECNVIKAHPILLDRECYEIYFSDNEKIIACAEHLWNIDTRISSDTWGWKTVTTEYIFNHIKVKGYFLLPECKPNIIQNNFYCYDRPRYIYDVKKVDSVPVRCITVDSPSRLYVAGLSMIPTHNTRAGAEWIVNNALVKGYKDQALVAPTHADLVKTMILGGSGIKSVCPEIEFNKSDKIITFPNGNKVYGYSAEKPDSLRGPNLYAAWVDELSSWRYDEECWDMLEMTLRIGDHPRIFVSSTPKPRPFFKKLLAMKRTLVTKCSTYANQKNLSPEFLRKLLERYEGTRLGRQELGAEILEDSESALWNRDLIEKCRRIDADVKNFSRIVVAVDPATTSNQKSDETGIVVCATDGEHGYILKDATMKGTPLEWGKRAIEMAEIFGANYIVAETNNGGDLVKTVLNSINDKIQVKSVHASVNKRARAEPVSMLYEQFKVHHVGSAIEFMELEDEMCSWDKKSTSSPNRIDAMVWGISQLCLHRQARIRML